MTTSLVKQIEIFREQLVKSVTEKGFTHPDTLKVSEELDKLVLQCQQGKV